LKRGGGRRYYRPADIEVIRGIQTLLYTDGYTIRGVQKVFRSQGIRFVAEVGKAGGIRLAPIAAPAAAAEPQLALEPANANVAPPVVAPEPALEVKPIRHKPYARTRSAPAPAAKGEPAQLSLVEPAALKVSEKERARFTERLAALSKLKTEIGAALSARSARAELPEPKAPRAARG
jgi:DNA-binding transcriptional MerR regulator